MYKHATILCSILVILLSAERAFAQAAPSSKFNDAIKRSKTGADVVGKIAEFSDHGVSKGLIAATEAIGVFGCHKMDMVVEYGVLCPGVVSRRLPSGWAVPAFYRLAAAGFGRPDAALSHAHTIILLFLSNESVGWLSQGINFENGREAGPGQIGPLTDAQLENLQTKQIVAYSIEKDTLTGITLSDKVAKTIVLKQDNHINQSLYGVKGEDILTNKPVKTSNVPASVLAFYTALEERFRK